jgi:hypothetical protein
MASTLYAVHKAHFGTPVMDKTGSWKDELFRYLPLWVKVTVIFSGILLACYVTLGVSFLIVNRNMDVEIGLKAFKATRPETTLEKNCRSESQAVATFDEGLNSHIGALNDQMTILVRDMDEIRKKCLAEIPTKITPRGSEAVDCDTAPDFLTNENPSGRYARVIRELAHQQEDIRSQVTGLREQQRERHQRLTELCFSH